VKEIDRKTLHLRGASGRFKPENPREAAECREALKQGASRCLSARDLYLDAQPPSRKPEPGEPTP
jgi:hypothetical protein